MRADGRVAIYQLRHIFPLPPHFARHLPLWGRQEKLVENPNEQLIYQQPSVIAYGDASSLDAKTQFVASLRCEKLLVMLMSLCDGREHIEVKQICED